MRADIKFPVKIPLMSLLAAAVRWLTVSVGVGADYAGDVLGEEQWEWLEGVCVRVCVCVEREREGERARARERESES
jgi:hypothetical protein